MPKTDTKRKVSTICQLHFEDSVHMDVLKLQGIYQIIVKAIRTGRFLMLVFVNASCLFQFSSRDRANGGKLMYVMLVSIFF
jgi:hypothetical protein